MAEKTSIVGANDKGQFAVSMPRSSIERVDVIDIDLVIQTKGGDRLILPGAAIEAMTASPPSVHFSDGVMGTGELLSVVDRVQTPSSSIPAMTSLTQFDQKRTEGKKNLTKEGADNSPAAQQAAEAQAQQVAPLPTQGGESAVDKLIAKAQQMEADIHKKAFDPAPVKPYEPPASGPDAPTNPPPSAKIPLYATLMEGNVVGVTPLGADIYGSGGPTGTALADKILVNDAGQYGLEVLTGTAASENIYADAFYKATNWTTTGSTLLNSAAAYALLDKETGVAPTGTAFYCAKEIKLNVAGYVLRMDSITVTGLPDGVSIEGATSLGGGSWSIPTGKVIPTAETLTLVYDVTKVKALGDVVVSFTLVGKGAEDFNTTRSFVLRFQDVDDTTDITTNHPQYIDGSGWTDVYVMPTASAPHSIIAGDGVNVIYAGNSNDTISAGIGNDTIYAYGGNDTITAGTGANLIWAGNGNDRVTTLGGDDIVHAGSGDNWVDAGDGANQVDSGAGSDTVITGVGDDTIAVGDGTKNIVWAGDGLNRISAGIGADTLIGGGGVDSISAGDGDDWIYGGAGNNNAVAGGTLDGGAGTDWLSFNGIDKTSATAGTATLSDWLKYAGTDITGVSLTTDASGSGTATKVGGTSDDVANIENLIGSQGNDTLDLSAYTGISHTLYGLDGNDVISGADGADILYGGAGQDSIWGNAGNDVIYTGITGIDGVQVTGTTTDAATSITNPGTLSYTAAAGGGGATFTGLANVANGGAGADTLVGGDGDDYFVGTTGESTDGTSTDTFIGGGGIDTVDHSTYTSNLVIDLANHTGRINGGLEIATYDSIERIITGSGDDSITGTTADEIFWAGNGNNTINVGGGGDTAYGGSGNDYFNSAVGATTIVGGVTIVNSASYNGGAGYNEYRLRAGVEAIDGSTVGSTDRLLYNNSAATNVSSVNYGIFVNLDATTNWATTNTGALTTNSATSYWYNGTAGWVSTLTANTSTSAGRGYFGDANGDTYVGIIEQVYGSGYNDVLIGNTGNNWFFAAAGNDAVYGLAGADTMTMMYGGTVNTGADFFDGGNDGAGADSYSLSANTNGALSWSGGDWITFSSGNNIDRSLTINLDSISHADAGTAAAANTVTGWSSTVTLANVEHASGGNYADVIYGSAADNVLEGGAGKDSLWGYDGNDFINGGSGADYIDGGTGNDWASYSGLGVGVEVYLADADLDGNGSLDQAAVAAWTINQARAMGQDGYDYDRLISIENIEGTGYADKLAGDGQANSIYGGAGDDTIFGADGNDVLNGGSGNDTLTGGTGADAMTGGTGNDTYYVDNVGDTIVELVNEGTDSVYTTVNYTLSANVEFLYAQGSTGLSLTGSSSNNSIFGSTGNDIIDGGAGNDYMAGGTGNDAYYVDSASDNVVEAASAGTDIVYTTINYTLTANVENLTGQGATGLTLTGNTLDNIITGTSGNDIITGGTGADSMIGGAGNDTYYVDNVGDTVTEAAGEGTDTISTTVSYTLSANVENLTATGNSGVTLTGNALDNIITGNSGANIIDGGAGADGMAGAGGNDTYYVDNVGDTVTEAAGAGTDTVYTSVNFTLTDNIEVMYGQGSTGLTLTGSSTNNTIYGTTGNDIINGSAGTDTLYGLAGSDTFNLTAAQTLTSTVIGGNNVTSGATESGTDTLVLSDNWNMGNLNTGRLHSIEAIDLRNGGAAVDIDLFGTQSNQTNARTVINGILDSSSNTTLHLYLDNGDRFNTANSASGAGYAANTNANATYTYGSSSIVVHWGSG